MARGTRSAGVARSLATQPHEWLGRERRPRSRPRRCRAGSSLRCFPRSTSCRCSRRRPRHGNERGCSNRPQVPTPEISRVPRIPGGLPHAPPGYGSTQVTWHPRRAQWTVARGRAMLSSTPFVDRAAKTTSGGTCERDGARHACGARAGVHARRRAAARDGPTGYGRRLAVVVGPAPGSVGRSSASSSSRGRSGRSSTTEPSSSRSSVPASPRVRSSRWPRSASS